MIKFGRIRNVNKVLKIKMVKTGNIVNRLNFIDRF